VGRKWKMISERYNSYLVNKDESFLQSKYCYLTKNEIQFQKLKEKANFVNDIEIDKLPYEKKELIRWSNKELTYLVLGFMKYRKISNTLLMNFKKYFHENRSLSDLAVRYGRLKKDTRKLKYSQKKALLLLKKSS
jgi:hypothetical protein